MRTGEIQIGGKAYPVAGLSVSKNLLIDFDTADALKDNNNEQLIKLRFRRMAWCLQKAEAFLPDPKNPAGELQSKDLSEEQIVAILDEVMLGSWEWHEAQSEIARVNGIIKPGGPEAAPLAAGAKEPGESPATGS